MKVIGGLVSTFPVFHKKTGTQVCFFPFSGENQQFASTEAETPEVASTWKSAGHPYPLLQLEVIETQTTKPTAIRTNFKEDTFMFNIALICFWLSTDNRYKSF